MKLFVLHCKKVSQSRGFLAMIEWKVNKKCKNLFQLAHLLINNLYLKRYYIKIIGNNITFRSLLDEFIILTFK